ncbi:MAG: hypothetical protein Cons2KO_19260 [Congregibacter sp.]
MLRAIARKISIEETARVITLFSYYDNVVTDRLHGALLAAKLGIPVRVYDNDHGKISRYLDTWHEKLVEEGARIEFV